MQLARVFADKLSTVDNLPSLQVAFLLAQVSTPEAVGLAVLDGECYPSLTELKQALKKPSARKRALHRLHK